MRKLVVFFASVLVLTSCASTHPKDAAITSVASCNFAKPTTANQLPAVSLPCLTNTGYSAERYSLQSLKGPLLLNLWGSWCGPCKEEMPLFRELYLATRGSKSLSIIGIDVEEASPKDGITFVKQYGMAWPQLADNEQKTRVDFGMGVPVTWFVNADGAVTYKKIGQIHSWAQLRGLVSQHLSIDVS